MKEVLFKKAFEAIPEQDKQEIMAQLKEIHEVSEDTDITEVAYIYVMEDMLLNLVDSVLATADKLEVLHGAALPEDFKTKEDITDEQEETFFKGFSFAQYVLGQTLLTNDTMVALMQILREQVVLETPEPQTEVDAIQ